MSMALRQDVLNIQHRLAQGRATEEVLLAQKQLLLRLVQLRAENRKAWQESRLAKQNTAEAKLSIDRLNLELQALHYEQRHLRNEIKSCQETPTVYQQITLIDEELFLGLGLTEQGIRARELMHARLNHEKEERLRLEAIRQGLSAKKAALIADNKKRKADLESLEKQLNNFIASADNISAIFKKR